MRTVTVNLYQFGELSAKAQLKACDWARNNVDDLYGWDNEARKSVEAFCEKFGVWLLDYQLHPYESINYKTDVNNKNFRGVRLSHIDREEMLTGYCLDCDLMHAFYDTFKGSGNALHAFDVALYAGFKAWRRERNESYSNDSIADFLRANEYEFTADGDKWEGE